MKRVTLAVLFALAAPAFAQSDDDAPIPYDDDTREEIPQKKRRHKARTDELREEEEEEAKGSKPLANLDDPNVGLGGDVFAGLALPDSSRGALVPRFVWGLRFTWEWGRLIPDEFLRELFFLDVTWSWTSMKDGTTSVNEVTNLHNLTLAPAVGIPFGSAPVMFYGQVGVGFDYADTLLTIDQNKTRLGGAKFLFQYGIGIRARPALTRDGSVRLTIRVEATRFVRGYMHDMYFAGALGLMF